MFGKFVLNKYSGDIFCQILSDGPELYRNVSPDGKITYPYPSLEKVNVWIAFPKWIIGIIKYFASKNICDNNLSIDKNCWRMFLTPFYAGYWAKERIKLLTSDGPRKRWWRSSISSKQDIRNFEKEIKEYFKNNE